MQEVLKTLFGKWTGRKILALVGTVATVVTGEATLPDFPTWALVVLGMTYIFVNAAQKFGLGWLELKRQKL